MLMLPLLLLGNLLALSYFGGGADDGPPICLARSQARFGASE